MVKIDLRSQPSDGTVLLLQFFPNFVTYIYFQAHKKSVNLFADCSFAKTGSTKTLVFK